MTLWGYARVSTSDQNLDMQMTALARAGVSLRCIATDTTSGADHPSTRPGWAKLRQRVRAGDTVTVWKLDRLSRSLNHLVATLADLEGAGVEVISLTETMETRTAAGQFVRNMFGAVAQFERQLIRERIREGVAARRARGERTGRPRKLSPAQAEAVRALRASKGFSQRRLAAMFGCDQTVIADVLYERRSYAPTPDATPAPAPDTTPAPAES